MAGISLDRPKRHRRGTSPLTLFCLLLCFSPANADWIEDEDADFLQFRTEPTFQAPPAFITINDTTDRTALGDGLFFIDPLHDGRGLGPMAYDQDGNLVWCGNHLMNGHTTRSQMTHPCTYKGSVGTHMCYNQVHHPGKVAAYNRILDNSYKPVKGPDLGEIKKWTWPNPHEHNMVDNGYSVIRTVYSRTVMDLTLINGSAKGYTNDGCFQEADVTSGKQNFRWCTFKHTKIDESYVTLWLPDPQLANDPAYEGMPGSENNAWDGAHTNSVDKTPEGDYLVSNRHFGSIVKVAGNNAKELYNSSPGSILWRVGGKKADIKFDDPTASFNGQHNVRWVSSNETGDTFSLFDNGAGGGEPSADTFSSGKLFFANNKTQIATLLQKWPHPQGKRSNAQGSMMILPNGNAIVGWGALPQFSEFGPSGSLLLHGFFGPRNMSEEKRHNYRVVKAPWVGRPSWKPKLLAYTRTCTGSPLVAYISWNGATEVRTWRFYLSTRGRKGPWLRAGDYRKSGFETRVELSKKLLTGGAFSPFISVEAIDGSGRVLATVFNKTFVPRIAYTSNGNANETCDDDGCPFGFIYRSNTSRAGACDTSLFPAIVSLFIVVVALEFFQYSLKGFWERAVPILHGNEHVEPFEDGFALSRKSKESTNRGRS